MNLTSKYIERDFAVHLLRDAIESHSKTPVEQGENDAYRIGHHLGYTDGLNHALNIIKSMAEAHKPERHVIYGRPETFPD